ncbi:hypothetical protein [Cupriavidus campinensis]|uniref:Uncharacterized protein n=1 Tax=Cupriavidus campinensis TaxID=151783 RepID=A0AAE9L4U4_9BURK|nr:hypothetical protein [Cupriavidus campinensis]URF06824.1 hypothetical protein M5D45_27515 [Cupriavidus campinensis]
MPVDFRRIPSKTVVPEFPQWSVTKWAVLFVAIVGGGAALALYTWPASQPTNTPWFWVRIVGYPLLAWVFIWSTTLAGAHTLRSVASAKNEVSERHELACHAQASMPLALLGHALRFSTDDAENNAQAVVGGQVQMVARTSAAFPKSATTSRWIAIPEKPFYPGNELSEHFRHEVITERLIDDLVARLRGDLGRLPSGTCVRVRSVVASSLASEEVCADIGEKLRGWFPGLSVVMSKDTDALSLFNVDAWADGLWQNEIQLLVAIQLRRAISEELPEGSAEAGVALLVGPPCDHTSIPTALHLHRPATGNATSASEISALATRWGRSKGTDISVVWSDALTDGAIAQLRSTGVASDSAIWIDLRRTIGDCGHAAPWLGVALAAEQAAQTASPQLVVAQEGDQIIALVCRTQS